MRIVYFAICLFVLSLSAQAQHPWMVKDVNTVNPPGTTNNILNNGTVIGSYGVDNDLKGLLSQFAPKDIYTVNGVAIFFGSDGKSNQGIFKTDGTSAGTSFVVSLPFTSGIQITNAYNTGKLLYFIFNDNSGYNLYRTDGTAAGTYLIYSGQTGSITDLTLSASTSSYYNG